MNNETEKKIITRMAPSPTGHLHIGTARTALFNFLFARANNGLFYMRSEDTDRARSTPEFEKEILDGFAWLGIDYDSFMRQSERATTYRTYLEEMIANDTAYLSKEESKQSPGTEVEIIRLRNPGKNITFTDELRGEITFDTTELGDIVIARSISEPLYHFAVVVDDYESGVTHILRGEDHISNTPRQILIQEALGAPRPKYIHLPLILAPDKSKLSKRHGAVALYEFKDRGILADALVNYLALLGWNPGTDEEIFTLDELIQAFSLKHIQKGGAVFDETKLAWINKSHLARLDDTTYYSMVEQALPKETVSLPQYSKERLLRLLPVIRERAHTMAEVTEAAHEGEYDFAFTVPRVQPDLLAWKNDAAPSDALPRLKQAYDTLTAITFESPEQIKEALWPLAEEIGKGELLWPLRVALTGREKSPDPFICSYILQREETLNRIEAACAKISQ